VVTNYSTNIQSRWDCPVDYLREQIAIGRKYITSQKKVPKGRYV
jgi:hypothetical protein